MMAEKDTVSMNEAICGRLSFSALTDQSESHHTQSMQLPHWMGSSCLARTVCKQVVAQYVD